MADIAYTLAPKHRLFADNYFKSGNAAGSYRDIYKCQVKAAASSACKLLKRPDIQAHLAALEAAKANITAMESILDEQETMENETVIVRHTLSDLLDENGEIKDLKDWPERVKRVVKDIEYGHMPAGSDEHGNATSTRYIRKIHFYDKGQALGRVEKVLGMNAPEKKEIGVRMDIRAILKEIDGDNRGKLPQDCD
jgi:sulfur relay (sulfurtransferase) DsrC/TusE family protein